jgi:hypothetical protein
MRYKYAIANQSLIMSKRDARTEVISTVIQKVGPKKFYIEDGNYWYRNFYSNVDYRTNGG